MDREDIKKYIRLLCGVLDISMPQIIYDSTEFATPTTIAQTLSDGEVIYLREDAKPNIDFCLAVAHELRHVWQIRKCPTMIQNYISSSEGDINFYAQQPAEVDANAFAQIVLTELFNIKPLWKDYNEQTKRMIANKIPAVLESLEK